MIHFLLASLVSAAEYRTVAEPVEGSYLVQLHEKFADNVEEHIQKLNSTKGFAVQRRYRFLEKYGFPAYAVNLDDHALKEVLSQPEVSRVEQDGVVRIGCVEQSSPTWGLSRISSRNSWSSGSPYQYEDQAGAGTFVYVLDTGIYAQNVDFGGRVAEGMSFVLLPIGGSTDDGNGHGTHCASTIGGSTYGVAKETTLVPVKVLSDAGSGTSTGVIDGMNWAAEQIVSNGQRGVLSMSLGGGYSAVQNDAVTAIYAAGVGVIVAAGNSNDNACDYSPASAGRAYTVGATDSNDRRSTFSCYGTCLDIFAPGTSITAAWIGNPTATNTISGTSMATPHVAGAAALLLGQGIVEPSALYAALTVSATSDIISNVGTGSPNQLLYSGC